MFKNEYKTLAMFICGVSGTFQKKFCRQFTDKALELGYNLLIFNAFRDFAYYGNEAYMTGEANIVNLPPYEELDGIIIVPDTFPDINLRNNLIETIRKRAACPVISFRTRVDGFVNVLIDNDSAMERLIAHFIVKHNMTRLALVNGPEFHQDAIVRGECFRRTLEKYGLTVHEEWIINGTFWFDRGKEHVDRLLSGSRETWPEAIVCANDYMAVAICDECFERGIRIPEDVAVSGFDNMPESMSCYPPLTTVDISVSAIVNKCFDILCSVHDGSGEAGTEYMIPARDIYRCSCGCESIDIRSLLLSVRYARKECDEMFQAARSNTYMSVRLQGLDNYYEMGRIFSGDYNNFRNLYICFCEEYTEKDKTFEPRVEGYPDKMNMVYGFRDRNEIPVQTFDTKELIPDDAATGKPMQFYFTPLHYQNNVFGYVVHSYDNNECFDKTFQNWMAVVGNAIENIRTRHMFSNLVEELNNQYLHESMTGLYNRRGFDSISREMYQRSVSEYKKMMILEIDMDNLKQVNDRYGHSEGDRAIDMIADALKRSAGNNAVCSRVGGDEFWVIAYDFDKKMMEQYIDNFLNILEQLDEKEDRPYDVAVSYGSVITDPDAGITLEEYINIADTRMYRNKRSRKKGRMFTHDE